MRSLFILAVLATTGASAQAVGTPAASSPATPAAATMTQPRELPTIGVVPIYLSGRRSLAMVRVGDHPPAPVVFDTGTTGNSLDTDFSEHLQLTYDPSVNVEVGDGTGKSFIAKEANIPVASLGGVPISEKTAAVYPYKERDVVGIYGPGSFAGKHVLLDLGNGRVIVQDKRALGANVPEGTPYARRLPAINVELPGGATVSALLDTGSDSVLLLPEEMARKLPLRGPLRIAGQLKTVTGQRPFYEGDLDGEVRIGKVVLKNPTIKFSGKNANVGLPIIRQLLIMLDPEKQTSWVVDPPVLSASDLAMFSGRYGIRTIRFKSGRLLSQRDDSRPYVLHPMGGDLFRLEGSADVVQFWREGGRVVRMDHISGPGALTQAAKTD